MKMIASAVKASLMGMLCIFSHAVSAAEMQWNLTDVSYLFQLPRGNAQAPVNLLRPQDQGNAGPLLPPRLYGQIPTLLIDGSGNATVYGKGLRVVGARIDPCPTGETRTCSPQVRLIWQPVEYEEFEGRWLARDAAVHCFYGLTLEKLEFLKTDLWEIKKRFADLGVDTKLKALDLHPALRNDRTADAFTHEINSVLLKYVGEDNLEKITYVALLVPTKWWRFGAFEKGRSGKWHTAAIPRLGAPTEDIFNVAVYDGIGLGPEKGIDAVFNVLPEDYPEADNLFAVINKGYRFNDARDRLVFRGKLDAIARFQNPRKTNVDNLDCATCHYADATKYYVGNRFKELKHVSSTEEFENPDPAIFNLENRTLAATSTRNVRAFGFFGDKPVISQRTINESALAAHWLNTNSKR